MRNVILFGGPCANSGPKRISILPENNEVPVVDLSGLTIGSYRPTNPGIENWLCEVWTWRPGEVRKPLRMPQPTKYDCLVIDELNAKAP